MTSRRPAAACLILFVAAQWSTWGGVRRLAFDLHRVTELLATGVNRPTAVGAVLFLMSDLVLGASNFVAPDNLSSQLLNMIIYMPAQLLIALGVLQASRESVDLAGIRRRLPG